MKTSFAILLFSFAVLTQNSEAATVTAKTSGYTCLVKAGTLTFNGGAKSEARRTFTDTKSMTVYLERSLMSGQLEPLRPNSLEFKPSESMILVDTKLIPNVLYPSVQTTEIYGSGGRVIKDETDLPEGDTFEVRYRHVFTKSPSGDESSTLKVTVSEEQLAGRTTFKSADFVFEYRASTSLPLNVQKELSGTAQAELICQRR